MRSYNDMFGLPYVCLRYFNVYGPRMDVHGKYTEVLVRWMEQDQPGLPPPSFSARAIQVWILLCADVAPANLLAAASPVTDDAFNIGTGVETSLKQLARVLLKVMGREDLEVEHAEERRSIPS